jgi:acetoin utilization deacetylase AcuC-like enzyme
MLLYTHADCLAHVTPPGHPESADRLRAVWRGLADLPLIPRACPAGEAAEVLCCHPPAYLARVEAAVPARGLGAAGRRYLPVARLLWRGDARGRGRLCGGRCGAGGRGGPPLSPPARRATMPKPPGRWGFCLFGTVAIAAKRALVHHGLSRVAIVDFDVHHGNGTQDLLWDEGRCLYASSHQMPLYPGTGRPENGARMARC